MAVSFVFCRMLHPSLRTISPHFPAYFRESIIRVTERYRDIAPAAIMCIEHIREFHPCRHQDIRIYPCAAMIRYPQLACRWRRSAVTLHANGCRPSIEGIPSTRPSAGPCPDCLYKRLWMVGHRRCIQPEVFGGSIIGFGSR